MPNYAALKDKKNELIRRARDGSVFIAERTVAAITDYTSGASGELTALPTGWEDLGWTSTDGVTLGRETESSQVRSFGSVEPTREDITNDTLTMAVVAQETKLLTLGLSIGIDTSALEADAVTGELQIAKPAVPASRSYRLFGLFVDEVAEGEIYMIREMPNAKITEYGETVYTSDGDDPVQYSLTFTGFSDSVLGYSHRWVFGGPGWLALSDSMGIPQATP